MIEFFQLSQLSSESAIGKVHCFGQNAPLVSGERLDTVSGACQLNQLSFLQSVFLGMMLI
jgi:hypothetical protein